MGQDARFWTDDAQAVALKAQLAATTALAKELAVMLEGSFRSGTEPDLGHGYRMRVKALLATPEVKKLLEE